MYLILLNTATWLGLGLMVIIALALVIGYSCSRNEQELKYMYNKALLSPDEKDFLNLLNGYRATMDIEPLLADKTAGFIAYGHCIKMANEQSVYHNDEDGRYDDLKGGSNFSEIVDGGFYNVLSCFRGFMGSDDHFNIINSKIYNTLGLSIERDDNDKVYCTVIFFKI